MPVSGPFVGVKKTNGEIEKYCMGVFRIVSRDERGRPEECIFIPEDRTVEFGANGGDEFMTAFVPVEVVDK